MPLSMMINPTQSNLNTRSSMGGYENNGGMYRSDTGGLKRQQMENNQLPQNTSGASYNGGSTRAPGGPLPASGAPRYMSASAAGGGGVRRLDQAQQHYRPNCQQISGPASQNMDSGLLTQSMEPSMLSQQANWDLSNTTNRVTRYSDGFIGNKLASQPSGHMGLSGLSQVSFRCLNEMMISKFN